MIRYLPAFLLSACGPAQVVFDALPCTPTRETLGDSKDADCDGGNDSAGFHFGGLAWNEPQRPVVAEDEAHITITTMARGLDDEGNKTKDVGITIFFDSASPDLSSPRWVIWQQSEPLGGAFDAHMYGPAHLIATTGIGQVGAVSFQRLAWNSGLSVYDTYKIFLQASVSDNSCVDIRPATRDDTYWFAASDANTIKFGHMGAGELGMVLLAEGEINNAGGVQCALHSIDVDTAKFTTCDMDIECSEYLLTGTTAQQSGTQANSPRDLHTTGDTRIEAYDDGGVGLFDDVHGDHKVLEEQIFLSVDATWVDEQLIVVGVTEEHDDVLVAWGTPEDLETTRFIWSNAQADLYQVGLHANSDYVVVAATGWALADPFVDVLGWAFFNTP